jgi:NAD(P)-dependent dehydrogenase (short-subunit alcohol dehydrogenase family)
LKLPPVAEIEYCIVKAGLNIMTLQYHIAEEQRPEAERVTFWAVSPGHCKTGFNGFRGIKDPVDGAEVVVRLLESEKSAIAGGTFWEFEGGKFQQPPW